MLSDYFLLKRNLSGLPERPLAAFFYLTNQCNLTCNFCEIGTGQVPHRKELTLAEIERFLNQLSEWGVKELYLTGGEPFVRKEIWDILSFCQTNGIRVSHVTTNGSLLDALNGEQKRLLKATVGVIQVSMDSADPTIHDQGRGKVGLHGGIVRFMKERNGNELPAIQFSSFITEGNYAGIPELVSLATECRADHLNFTPVNFSSNFPDMQAEPEKRKPQFVSEESRKLLMETLTKAERLSRSLGQSTNLLPLSLWIDKYFAFAETGKWFFDEAVDGFICSKPFNYLHVNCYGDILPCALLKGKGNLKDEQVETAWRRLATEFKDILLQGNYFPECRSCYCDFPTNLRNSLFYHPWRNRNVAKTLIPYYVSRKRKQN